MSEINWAMIDLRPLDTLEIIKMDLQEEIETRRRLIKTDSYSMSIGELMSIYQSKELDLRPEFQRFFR